jgi:hypothetical protein
MFLLVMFSEEANEERKEVEGTVGRRRPHSDHSSPVSPGR